MIPRSRFKQWRWRRIGMLAHDAHHNSGELASRDILHVHTAAGTSTLFANGIRNQCKRRRCSDKATTGASEMMFDLVETVRPGYVPCANHTGPTFSSSKVGVPIAKASAMIPLNVKMWRLIFKVCSQIFWFPMQKHINFAMLLCKISYVLK